MMVICAYYGLCKFFAFSLGRYPGFWAKLAGSKSAALKSALAASSFKKI